MPPELLIATRNPGKVLEVRSLLARLPVRLRSLEDFPETTEVSESGKTFEENAGLKARAYSLQTGCWTLADDSGLVVDALGGAPGLFSARYGGPGASDAERIELLLKELGRTLDRERRARFVCVLALADHEGSIRHLFKGICAGRIAHEPRGSGGFGYDPVFIPEGYTQSFGELPSHVKQEISHRARALLAARPYLMKHFGPQA